MNTDIPVPGDTADENSTAAETPRHPRRPTALAVAVVALVLAVAGGAWAGNRPSHSEAPVDAAMDVTMVAPDGVLDISRVSPAVAAEFHYAAGHLDAYRQLRCWCGCEKAFDHHSLADCFVRPDGAWEAHGAGCGVCISSAMVVRQRLDAGVPIGDIAAEIDAQYRPAPKPTT